MPTAILVAIDYQCQQEERTTLLAQATGKSRVAYRNTAMKRCLSVIA